LQFDTRTHLCFNSYIQGVNVDTAHFDGNHGIGCSVQGLTVVYVGRQRKEAVVRWFTSRCLSLMMFFPSDVLCSNDDYCPAGFNV